MFELLKILTSKYYLVACLTCYLAVVLLQVSTVDLFDFEILYKPSLNFGLYILFVFVVLRIIVYIWQIKRNSKRKSKRKLF